jgi:hypothetical protein
MAMTRINMQFGTHLEGHKFKVTKLLASIKEKPNDSEKNDSDPSSGNGEHSGSRSGEDLKGTEQIEQIFDYAHEDDQDEPVIVEEFRESDPKQGMY